MYQLIIKMNLRTVDGLIFQATGFEPLTYFVYFSVAAYYRSLPHLHKSFHFFYTCYVIFTLYIFTLDEDVSTRNGSKIYVSVIVSVGILSPEEGDTSGYETGKCADQCKWRLENSRFWVVRARTIIEVCVY